jgi:cell division protein FtsZ
MAVGEGKGKSAADDAIASALSNPLFDAPLRGCSGILLNVKGGKDLTLAQVHRIAAVIRDASHSDAEVLLGVVNDKRWKKRITVTLVATGIRPDETSTQASDDINLEAIMAAPGSNGHSTQSELATRKLF